MIVNPTEYNYTVRRAYRIARDSISKGYKEECIREA